MQLLFFIALQGFNWSQLLRIVCTVQCALHNDVMSPSLKVLTRVQLVPVFTESALAPHPTTTLPARAHFDGNLRN